MTVHGTRSGYTRGCRCADCTAANAAYQRAYMGEFRRRHQGDEPPRHGTAYAYNYYGCRCADCTAANSRKSAERAALRHATSCRTLSHMEQTLVKTLTTNLRAIAALPVDQHPEKWFRKLRRDVDEKASAYRVRALEVIGDRWGYAASTVRAMEDGNRHGDGSAQFLEDMHRYGAVEFRKDGGLIVASLGKGPSPSEYVLGAAERRRAMRTSARA